MQSNDRSHRNNRLLRIEEDHRSPRERGMEKRLNDEAALPEIANEALGAGGSQLTSTVPGALLARAHEEAALHDVVCSAQAGQSGVLIVRGVAGIGKTSLLDR